MQLVHAPALPFGFVATGDPLPGIRYEPGALVSSGLKELIEISILVAQQVGWGTSRYLAVQRLFWLGKSMVTIDVTYFYQAEKSVYCKAPRGAPPRTSLLSNQNGDLNEFFQA